MLNICTNYHKNNNAVYGCNGVCYSTKEHDYCYCNGDPLKCDFYNDVREDAITALGEDKMISRRELLTSLNNRVLHGSFRVPDWIIDTIMEF